MGTTVWVAVEMGLARSIARRWLPVIVLAVSLILVPARAASAREPQVVGQVGHSGARGPGADSGR